jgi:hypothetical protein
MIAFVDAGRRFVNRGFAITFHPFAQLCKIIVDARDSRRKLEAELLRNRYRITSKTTTTFRSRAEVILRQKPQENVSW